MLEFHLRDLIKEYKNMKSKVLWNVNCENGKKCKTVYSYFNNSTGKKIQHLRKKHQINLKREKQHYDLVKQINKQNINF